LPAPPSPWASIPPSTKRTPWMPRISLAAWRPRVRRW